MTPPTDLEILSAIYDRYYETFAEYGTDRTGRSSKIYVPIDVDKVAAELDVDGDIVFSRLYYHLNKKHSYSHDDGTGVQVFAISVGGDPHCVNFPLVASILADLRPESQPDRTATTIALISLAVALASLFISIFA